MYKELIIDPKKHSELFWSTVKSSWPETSVINEKDILGKDLNVCVVVCPLYAQGDLSTAGLIKPPLQIEDSRVANKFKAYNEVLQNMNGSLTTFGGNVNLHAIFANRGVLFPGLPSDEDQRTLEYHEELYSVAYHKFAQVNHMNLHWSTYNDHNVNFPQFVDLSHPQSLSVLTELDYVNKETELIAHLNAYFNSDISTSKKNRHIVERVLSMNGMTFNGAFWLIAGYMSFDHKIADIVGHNGIYVVAERLEPLFGIARFTESLRQMTRIQIKA